MIVLRVRRSDSRRHRARSRRNLLTRDRRVIDAGLVETLA